MLIHRSANAEWGSHADRRVRISAASRFLQAARIAVLLALLERPTHAGGAVAVGPIGGLTLCCEFYSQTYTIGVAGAFDRRLSGPVSFDLAARAQFYRHREDEGLGSEGARQELTGGIRLEPAEPFRINPFFVASAGLAIVERRPFGCYSMCDHFLAGYTVGVSIGADLHSTHDAVPIWRAQLSFDMPSFTVDNDRFPAIKVSLALMAAFSL